MFASCCHIHRCLAQSPRAACFSQGDCANAACCVQAVLNGSALLQGRVVLSLEDLKQQGVMKHRAPLQDGKSQSGRLDFTIEWSSYLGIDSVEKQQQESRSD